MANEWVMGSRRGDRILSLYGFLIADYLIADYG